MQIHRTVFLLMAILAASSLNAQVPTSQVNIPVRTTVSVSSGEFAFFDRVVLSGSMNLTAQNNSTDSCLVQQPGGMCVIITLVDVFGTGLETGISYRAEGASIFSVPPAPVARGGITFTGSYRITADPLLAYWGLMELPDLTLPISVGLNSNGQMTSATVSSRRSVARQQFLRLAGDGDSHRYLRRHARDCISDGQVAGSGSLYFGSTA